MTSKWILRIVGLVAAGWLVTALWPTPAPQPPSTPQPVAAWYESWTCLIPLLLFTLALGALMGLALYYGNAYLQSQADGWRADAQFKLAEAAQALQRVQDFTVVGGRFVPRALVGPDGQTLLVSPEIMTAPVQGLDPTAAQADEASVRMLALMRQSAYGGYGGGGAGRGGAGFELGNLAAALALVQGASGRVANAIPIPVRVLPQPESDVLPSGGDE